MKIFTDKNNIICAIGTTSRTDVTGYEIEDEMFRGKCQDYIFGYKYEPTFELLYNHETGEVYEDEEGNPRYAVDKNGNKIVVGFSCYPYIDYTQLCLIQAEYELKQMREENTRLQLALCEIYESLLA